jgi:murein DD-endopeptidase MepM/ murein hydrolase activator NlpD
MTRYAHLRNVPNELAVDDRLLAGDIIGYVGATGTATGPNLHYEVRVNGRATDPLLDDRLAKAIDAKMSDTAAMQKLKEARALLTARLPARANGTTSESI